MRSPRLFVEICDELSIIVRNAFIIFFILQTLKRSLFCLFFSVYFISNLFRLCFLRIWIGYTLIFNLIIDFFGP